MWHIGPMYTLSPMEEPTCEKMVPNSMVADAAQCARTERRKAVRRYCPNTPGMSASAWDEPIKARSGPSTRRRTWYEHTAGVTRAKAVKRATVLSVWRADKGLHSTEDGPQPRGRARVATVRR